MPRFLGNQFVRGDIWLAETGHAVSYPWPATASYVYSDRGWGSCSLCSQRSQTRGKDTGDCHSVCKSPAFLQRKQGQFLNDQNWSSVDLLLPRFCSRGPQRLSGGLHSHPLVCNHRRVQFSFLLSFSRWQTLKSKALKLRWRSF